MILKLNCEEKGKKLAKREKNSSGEEDRANKTTGWGTQWVFRRLTAFSTVGVQRKPQELFKVGLSSDSKYAKI